MPTNNVRKADKSAVYSDAWDFTIKHSKPDDPSAAWTSDGYARLRTYLGNQERGNDRIYTAPFYNGVPTSKLLAEWRSHLESLSSEWPSLLQFEDDLAAKVGPMSIQKPLYERLPDIRHYYEDILLSSEPIDPSAIKAVISEFASIRGLAPRSQFHTLELMKKSTSSGNPWFTKKRDVVQEILPCFAVYRANLKHFPVQGFVQDKLWHYTAVIGWRGQEGGLKADDVKQRVVWMFPFAVNLQELQVYQPLIEAAQSQNLVPAWVSMESVDREITALFDSKAPDDLIVCTDFSKFDQHFNRDMQACSQEILSAILTPGNASGVWLRDVYPIKYHIPLTWRADDYSYLSLRGPHGMASGSGGTNADETLAHRALQYEVAIRNHARLNPHSMCLGDDGILTYPGITVDAVVDAYSSHGQECNVSKQYASTQDCVYLRRWHHKDYRVDGICAGVYSTCRAIGRLRYLERFMDPEYWNEKMVALRQLSILENCKFHPMFHEFVDWCMEGDKYRLGIDIPGFLDNIARYAIEATDHMPDFLGYTKTLQGGTPEGIADWEIVKYLKSLR